MAAGGGASLSVSSIVQGLLSTSASHSAPAPSISALAASQLPNPTTRCNWGAIARNASSAAAMSLVDLRKPRLVPSLSPIPRRSNRKTGKPAAAISAARRDWPLKAPARISLPPLTISRPVVPGALSSVAAQRSSRHSKLRCRRFMLVPSRGRESQPAHRPAWHRNRSPHAATAAARRHRPARLRRA